MVGEAHLDKLIGLLLDNDIAIMSLGSGTSAFPPLKKLYDAGVKLCTGTDGVHDLWGIYNSVNLLDRVRMLGYRCGFRRDEDVEFLLDVATYGGATVMKDDDYGLAIGKNADFLVIDGETPAQAVVDRPAPRYVIKGGQIVVENGTYIKN